MDAAIIFADLLLPLEVMGLPFRFSAGEGPVIEKPVRDEATSPGCAPTAPPIWDMCPMRCGWCASTSELVAGDRILRRSLYPGQLHDRGRRLPQLRIRQEDDVFVPAAWDELMAKLVSVTSEYAAEQVRAGADTIQIFDSWVGCLSVEDYRRYVLPRTTELVKKLQQTGVPIIYFGTDSSTLLPSMRETGAEVIGLDWRIPLDEGWRALGSRRGARKPRSGAAICGLERSSSRAPRTF